MTLDPQARAALEILAMSPPIDYEQSGAQIRAAMAALPPEPSPFAAGDEVERIEDMTIDGPAGPTALRIYVPRNARLPLPVTVYYHGGGFVFGSPAMFDNICRCLANRAHTLVISVDYRLAPEAPFPAAVDDATNALRWARTHAATLGGDPTRLAVAGDSAGGNLAAVVAQLARQEDISLAHQLLLCPVTDTRLDTDSHRDFAEGYFLTTKMMRWFWRQYLPSTASWDDARAAPLRRSDLAGVAPATIITAEYDPLRDEGEAYAHALKAADVPVLLRRWPGQIHGFNSMLGVIDAADHALTLAADALGAAFRNAMLTAPAR